MFDISYPIRRRKANNSVLLVRWLRFIKKMIKYNQFDTLVLICYVIKEFLNNQNIFESLLIMICCYGYCTKLNVMKYNQQIPVWGRKYQFHKFFFINHDWSSGESFVFVRINLCVCNRRANKVQYEAHCIWQYVNKIVFF